MGVGVRVLGAQFTLPFMIDVVYLEESRVEILIHRLNSQDACLLITLLLAFGSSDSLPISCSKREEQEIGRECVQPSYTESLDTPP